MPESTPLISVVVPIYKAQEYLSVCLDSITAQTYKNLEIILVDDGSPDDCGRICDAYAERDKRIRVIHQENAGVSAARNAALKAATGEYVGFIDSDDSAHPRLFEILYARLVESEADVSVCRLDHCDKQEGNGRGDIEPLPETKVFEREEALENLLISKYYGGQLYTKLFKRELLDGVLLDESLLVIEDLEFCVRAMLRADRVCYTPIYLYNYFERDASLLHGSFAPKHYSAHEATVKVIETLKENGLYERLRPYADAAVVTANMIIMRKLYGAKDYRKQYCCRVRENIRRHLNKKSFSLLARATRLRAALMATSWRLYFLALKFHL